MRSERGQTAVEYIGVLVVISLVVGALAQTALGDAIASRAKRIVCAIDGSSCGDATPPSQTSDPPDGPTEGPPIGNGPRDFPVLPFPGSVSVTCNKSRPAGAKTCKKPEGANREAGVRAKGTVTRSPNKLNPLGCPVTTVGVSAALEAYGKAKVGDKEAGAGVELYGGASANYDVTVTPDRADAIAGGTDEAPNPLDPRTLGTGEGIEMSEKYYAGLNLSGNYRALQASMGFEKGRKLSTGVRRMDAGTVRIYVGDSDYVKNALTLGVSAKNAKLYLGNDTTFSQGKLRAIDLDVSTPQGWAAYQAFARTGKLPKTGTAGSTNPTSSETAEITSVSKLGAEIGNLDASVTLGDSEGHLTMTHNPDGSTTKSVDSRYRNVGLQVVRTTDANGNETGSPTFALNFKGVDSHVLQAYQQVNGLPQNAVKDGNLRLQYTADELAAIRNQAADHIRWQFEQNRGDVPSREDILRQMAGNPYAAVKNADGVQISPNPLDARLAAAKSPEDTLVALYDTGSGNASSAVDGLTHFALQTDYARHHGKPTRGQLDAGDRLPGTPVTPDCA